MLTIKQVKCMTKPYSDRAMTKEKVIYDDGWWSNGFVFIREPKPEKVGAKCDITRGHLNNLRQLAKWETGATTQVWPVETRPTIEADHKDKPFAILLHLTNGNGLGLWVDARYFLAICKRCKDAEFFLSESMGLTCLVAKNDNPFAVLAGFKTPDPERVPEWSLRNEDIPLAGGDDD